MPDYTVDHHEFREIVFGKHGASQNIKLMCLPVINDDFRTAMTIAREKGISTLLITDRRKNPEEQEKQQTET